jgi:ribonuclease P protein component
VARVQGKHDFPRTVRLRTSGDFDRVQKRGRGIDLGPLVFRVAAAEAGEGPKTVPASRLGLTVSKKVGNAVQRNRVKRLVRDCFRRRKADLAGYDVVAIGRPAAAGLAQREVDLMFDELVRRLRPG